MSTTKMMTTGEPLLQCREIDVSYGSSARVLHGVTIELPRGGVVALLGPNGAGKTTVARTIMGLIEGQPARGEVRFDGRSIDRWTTGARVRAGLACVPEGREIFRTLSVRENLLMGGWSGAWARGRQTFDEIYARFPLLAAMAHRSAGTLSGGEQQVLAIARAMMSRPKALLIDEPSLGLAPRAADRVFSILSWLVSEGTSLLLIEQNTKRALELAHHVYVLENGRIALSRSKQEIGDASELKDVYMGRAAPGWKG